MILKKKIFLITKWSELISKCPISVSLSDQYIYFLFNPNIKLSDDFKNEIWVFDWTGKSVKRIIADWSY